MRRYHQQFPALFYLVSGLVGGKRKCLFPNSLRKTSEIDFERTELGHMTIPESHCGEGNRLFSLDLLGSISFGPHEQRIMRP